MNSTVNEITKSFIGRFSLYDSDTEELQQLTSQYPFFGPAQFLLAKRLKQDNSPLFSKHIQKASLYFQNPVWFDLLLNDPDTRQNQSTSKIENAFFLPLAQMEIPATYEVVLDQTKTKNIPDSIPGEQHEQKNPELFIRFPKFKFEPVNTSNAELHEADEEFVYSKKNEPAGVDITAIDEEYFAELITEKVDDSITDEQIQTSGSPDSFHESEFDIIDSSTTEIPVTKEEVVDQAKTDLDAVDIIADEQAKQNQPPFLKKHADFTFETIDAAEVETPVANEEVVDQTKTDLDGGDRIAEEHGEQNQPALVIEFPKFKFEPVDPSKAEPIFEPFHTIDYFASQGIRNKEEEKPKDQFSRQLKSFTEWLKIMKRLPVSDIASAVSLTDEKNVEKMAEISINDREVVTEAMAEVWEKQGKAIKAIEVYQKLSLLNPGKSSYFAAKIEKLKNF